MGFNLNRSNHPDYKLKSRLMAESINMYGVEVDYLFTTKMNKDKILMDFSHLKTSGESKKITLLPEDPAGWSDDIGWSMFGLSNNRTINFFAHTESLKILYPEFKGLASAKDIINSLIVLPSGTIMEITDMKDDPEGVNNLFTYGDEKSAYMLVTKVYSNSQQNEIDAENLEAETNVPEGVEGVEIDYETPQVDQEQAFDDLDDYFKSLDDTKIEQDIEGIPIKNSDSVFGNLG